jgi:hypothetical protein
LSTLRPTPPFALGLLLAVNGSCAVGTVFSPVGTWTEQHSTPAAAFAFVLVEQRCFQFPVQRQDCGSEIFTDQRPGNTLNADTGFPAVVQQQAVSINVVTALVYQPLNTLELAVG